MTVRLGSLHCRVGRQQAEHVWGEGAEKEGGGGEDEWAGGGAGMGGEARQTEACEQDEQEEQVTKAN